MTCPFAGIKMRPEERNQIVVLVERMRRRGAKRGEIVISFGIADLTAKSLIDEAAARRNAVIRASLGLA